jgi:hypothetical protein
LTFEIKECLVKIVSDITLIDVGTLEGYVTLSKSLEGTMELHDARIG